MAQVLSSGEPYAIRFKSGDADVRFHDLVRGEVTFPATTLDDFIILRTDGSPTYHLSVVCDDVEMRITHVIRGEDHISNTPKHIELFRALGSQPPVFGHLPLILGPDRKRLSKRTGAASVEEFRDQGMLPAAVYNYLVLLGWSPGEDREVMTREEMIALFTVERLNASAAVFDPEKLRWMNAQYLMSTPIPELLPYLEPFLVPLGLGGLQGAQRERLLAVLDLHRTRARTLQELAPQLVPYFRERLSYDADACAKFLNQPHLPAHLQQLADAYSRLEPFAVDTLEAELRRLATELGLKAGDLIHPTRMALSGEQKGPPLFDLVAIMGREATLRHLGNFASFLQESAMEAGTLL